MTSESPELPWGVVLSIITVLALANAWFEPFEDSGPAETTSGVDRESHDPMVRKSRGWTSFRRATITPGIQTLTDGAGQCTTNFVFTDAAGEVYLGQAAHCATTGDEENGCEAPTRPLGTRVTFNAHGTRYDAGEQLGRGRLAYSSWRTMQRRGEKNRNACAFNDFALVRVARGSRDKVNPSLPYWGGPTGLPATGVDSYSISRVYGYGRSSLREDGSPYSRQAATLMPGGSDTDGWSHTIYSPSPGIPGDSGSGYVDGDGRAMGTLSTLVIDTVLWNGLGDLASELRYARRHSGIVGLKLEVGTIPFDDSRGR
ncbi:hypothetical protein D0Z08_24030 [Nocardioides immobilis]|uniref:Serine protease n=1 Tax=Nocardioides immobilis TaxID=2049295 RepID=A0A417XVR4_9ACTN|nr:hypothetical protein [Nocardioides immobilis]RHW24589.1 hypothetical protein D0Z08_24030 [Nocardioides immobilis]